jgi:hypothetical protein
VALALATKTISGATFHPSSYCDTVDEQLIFCGFSLESFCSFRRYNM